MDTLQGGKIDFFLNDLHVKEVVSPEITALNFIRDHLQLTGAKEVCAEGDCGACTIALGQWQKDAFVYKAINSCLLPATRLHGCHVITVEGLAKENKLHIIQQQMLDNHAVQCGYCTAGMIMSLFCLLMNNPSPSMEDIYVALEGNLCRCTGYDAIRKAANSLIGLLKNEQNFKNFLPSYVNDIQQKLRISSAFAHVQLSKMPVDICEGYFTPASLKDLFTLMAKYRDAFKIINGGTDLMVAANLQGVFPQYFLDISRINELNFIKEESNKIIVGGAVTLNQVLSNELVQQKIPVLPQALRIMASNQIRNIATLAGNIVNASPIADSACVLLALDATLILQSSDGERAVKLADFYRDYKVVDLNKNSEIISKIEINIEPSLCNFEKSSKRRTLDISSVNSTIFLKVDENGIIRTCRLAYGGVSKYPMLAKNCANYLVGKKVTSEVVAEAAKMAEAEFQPLSDIRGSATYRKILIGNHVLKHFNSMKLL